MSTLQKLVHDRRALIVNGLPAQKFPSGHFVHAVPPLQGEQRVAALLTLALELRALEVTLVKEALEAARAMKEA